MSDDKYDSINRPFHYNFHPSGIECIAISRYMNFCLGNVLKYIWRVDLKGNNIEDLEKARYYLNTEIELRKSNLSRGIENRERSKIKNLPSIQCNGCLGLIKENEPRVCLDRHIYCSQECYNDYKGE